MQVSSRMRGCNTKKGKRKEGKEKAEKSKGKGDGEIILGVPSGPMVYPGRPWGYGHEYV